LDYPASAPAGGYLKARGVFAKGRILDPATIGPSTIGPSTIDRGINQRGPLTTWQCAARTPTVPETLDNVAMCREGRANVSAGQQVARTCWLRGSVALRASRAQSRRTVARCARGNARCLS